MKEVPKRILQTLAATLLYAVVAAPFFVWWGWAERRELAHFKALLGSSRAEVEQREGPPSVVRKDEYVCPVMDYCPKPRGVVLIYGRVVDESYHLYFDEKNILFEVRVFGS
jgi:hypothetical protein